LRPALAATKFTPDRYLGLELTASLRALVSAVLGGCFAIVLMAGAGTPPCDTHAAHSSPSQSPLHPMGGPMGGHHGSPAGPIACAAHLCCLHVGPGAPSGPTVSTAAECNVPVGIASALARLAGRIPYLLPFGHAPPPLPA
jgi:hypothetical protein